jgi:hypothetical protein
MALRDVGLDLDFLEALLMAEFLLLQLTIQNGEFVLAILSITKQPEQVRKRAGDESQQGSKEREHGFLLWMEKSGRPEAAMMGLVRDRVVR